MSSLTKRPEWEDNDLFKLSKMERDRLKQQVAKSLGIHWQSGSTISTSLGIKWAHEVGGIQPISPETAEAAAKKFKEKLENRPKKTSSEPEDDFKKRMKTWEQDLDSLSSWATVVSATQISWESPNGPWNVGYIENFSEKITSGELKWDVNVERKAGGLNLENLSSLCSQSLVVSNSASMMALVRLVVGKLVRTGSIDDELKRCFMSMRVNILWSASKDEIVNLSSMENIEQHKRRRHSEFDNIFQVKQWMESMPLVKDVSLNANKAIDVVKYALVMGNPLKPSETPQWLLNLLRDKEPSMKNKLNVVASTSGFTKKYIEDHKIMIEHPEMKNYQRVVQRVRSVVGFSQWEQLHEVVVQELSRQGYAHKPCPLTSQLLLDTKILTSNAFQTKAEQENVPLWRDGQRGKDIHAAMVEVARARLFDHRVMESLQSVKSLFPNGGAWASFARLNGPPSYFLDSVLASNFGSKEAWTDSVKTTYKAIWTGEFDNEIAKLGSMLPSPLDGQPTQMRMQLQQMFSPISTLIHAHQSEAQQVQ